MWKGSRTPEKAEALASGTAENTVSYRRLKRGYAEYTPGVGGGECTVVEHGAVSSGLSLSDTCTCEEIDGGWLIAAVEFDGVTVSVHWVTVCWIVVCSVS